MKVDVAPEPTDIQTPYILQHWSEKDRCWLQYNGVWAKNDEQAIAMFRRFVPPQLLEGVAWNVVRVLAFSSTGSDA